MFVILFLILDETAVCISEHVQIQGWNSPLQKLRVERVKKKTGMNDVVLLYWPKAKLRANTTI